MSISSWVLIAVRLNVRFQLLELIEERDEARHPREPKRPQCCGIAFQALE